MAVSVSTLVTTVRDRFLNVGQQVTLIFSAGDNDKMTGTAYIKKSEVSAAWQSGQRQLSVPGH